MKVKEKQKGMGGNMSTIEKKNSGNKSSCRVRRNSSRNFSSLVNNNNNHFCILFIFVVICTSFFTRCVATTPCPNSCNGHGICQNAKRVCECYDGFEGNDCSRLSCPKGKAWTDFAIGVDDAHNEAMCSNMGLCDYATGNTL